MRDTGWRATWYKRGPILRTLLLLAYRLFLVVFLVTLFSFAALDQPVLRSLYVAMTSAQRAVANQFEFLKNISDTSDTFVFASRAYVRSLILLLSAVTVGSIIGLVLGIVSGLRPGSRVAGVASAVSFFGILTPSFLLALFVLLLFVRYISPAVGVRLVLIYPGVEVFDPRRLLAPALVLGVRPMAFITQVTIGALQEVMQRDYVRTAYAKGLSPWVVLMRHVLPNIALPALTALNSSIFFSLSSLLIVEWLFAWGGVGFWLLQAVQDRDEVLASYLLVSIGVTFLLINTAVKVLIRRLDPREGEYEAVVS